MKKREDQLWNYAEGRLQDAERAELERWLAADSRHRRQLEEVSTLSRTLQSMETDAPSMRFTARVMEAWDRELALRISPLQTHTDKRVVYGIAALLAGTLLLTFGLLFSLPEENAFVPNGWVFPENSFSGIGETLSGLFEGFSHYFIGTIILLLMVLLERYLHYKHYIRSGAE